MLWCSFEALVFLRGDRHTAMVGLCDPGVRSDGTVRVALFFDEQTSDQLKSRQVLCSAAAALRCTAVEHPSWGIKGWWIDATCRCLCVCLKLRSSDENDNPMP